MFLTWAAGHQIRDLPSLVMTWLLSGACWQGGEGQFKASQDAWPNKVNARQRNHVAKLHS